MLNRLGTENLAGSKATLVIDRFTVPPRSARPQPHACDPEPRRLRGVTARCRRRRARMTTTKTIMPRQDTPANANDRSSPPVDVTNNGKSLTIYCFICERRDHSRLGVEKFPYGRLSAQRVISSVHRYLRPWSTVNIPGFGRSRCRRHRIQHDEGFRARACSSRNSKQNSLRHLCGNFQASLSQSRCAAKRSKIRTNRRTVVLPA